MKEPILEIIQLPTEIILDIFKFFEPLAMVSVVLACKTFLIASEDYWKNKTQQHFIFADTKTLNNNQMTWHQKFNECWNKDYGGKPSNVKELFYLVKEKKFEELKKRVVAFSDFHLTENSGCELIEYIADVEEQSLRNHFYNIVKLETLKKISQSLPNDKAYGILLYWSIYLRQEPNIIYNKVYQIVDTRETTYLQDALILAAQQNNIYAMKTIFNRAVRINPSAIEPSPLHLAMENGHGEAVKLLIHKGASINTKRSADGMTALHIAAIKGDLEIAEHLIEKNADIDSVCKKGFTPLYYATTNNKLDVMNCLLEKKANIDAAGPDGQTSVHIAVYHDNLAALKLLLNNKPNLNAVLSDGCHPLQLAVHKRNTDIINCLLKNGADINLPGPDGRTPLYRAVDSRDIGTAKLLLARGADVKLAFPSYPKQDYDTPFYAGTFFRSYEKELKLASYSNDVEKKPDDSHRFSFTFFRYKLNLGPSALEEKMATRALKKVVLRNKNSSALDPHRAILNSGELKTIYESFKLS